MKILHSKYVLFTVYRVFFNVKKKKKEYLKVPVIEKLEPQGDSEPCSHEG